MMGANGATAVEGEKARVSTAVIGAAPLAASSGGSSAASRLKGLRAELEAMRAQFPYVVKAPKVEAPAPARSRSPTVDALAALKMEIEAGMEALRA